LEWPIIRAPSWPKVLGSERTTVIEGILNHLTLSSNTEGIPLKTRNLDTHEKLHERIASVLQLRREELGLLQSEVAKLLDVARSTVSHLENGKHEYNYCLLRELANALDMDMFRLALMVESPEHQDDPVIVRASEKIRARLAELDNRRKIK
jgi:transcriptional regulator with XRE-family HTH domain